MRISQIIGKKANQNPHQVVGIKTVARFVIGKCMLDFFRHQNNRVKNILFRLS